MSTEKEFQMEQEWRALILSKLNNMEQMSRDMQGDISLIKETFVRQVALDKLKDDQKVEIDLLKARIESMELSRSRLVGIVVGVSSCVTLLGWFIGVVVLHLTGSR